MDILLAALDRRCPSRSAARVFAIVLALIAAALIVGGIVVNAITPVSVTLGALAGLAIFCAGYVVIAHVVSPELSEKLNFRGRFLLTKRRWIAFWIVIGWVLLLILFGRYATSTVILGALNVAVLLGVWRLGSMTEGERILQEAQYAAEEEAEWIASEEVEVTDYNGDDLYEEYDEEVVTDWPENDPGDTFIPIADTPKN